MLEPAVQDPVVPARWTAERYLRLVDEGVLGPDDRVELLEGVIVSRRYRRVAIARRGDVIEPVTLPGVRIAVDDLLPSGIG